MSGWTDLFTVLPLPENWLRALLFVSFGLHMLFALLTVGTTLLGMLFLVYDRFHGLPAERDMRSHLGLRTLLVVLGVAPLLIIQVRYPHAFFTATGLFAYGWLALIPLIIISFLLLDGLRHTERNHHSRLTLTYGIISAALLLTVPAVFTGVLTLMERQEAWPVFGASGFGVNGALALHWLLRYLHVIGASCLFGAAFLLLFAKGEEQGKVPRLRNWLFGAVLAQIVIGIPLLFTVAKDMNWAMLWVVTLGAAAAMALLWIMRPGAAWPDAAVPRGLLVLLPLIFVAMLASRQMLQDRAVMPVEEQAVLARKERAAALQPYQQQALQSFSEKLATVYDNGETIYVQACAACHGGGGQGDGPAAVRLMVPAEELSAIRADREYIYGILKDGTPGTAMPYFRHYDREKLDLLLDWLSETFGMFDASPAAGDKHGDRAQAATVWAATCATCHGADGGISDFGRTLRPSPPDFRRFSLTPERAMDVITAGYPGTVMQPFRALPENLRRDLAGMANSFRSPDKKKTQ
ncbi:MAG: c-type cytochrome [Deltaproteobacteria bacterium]|jgi:mono/diheme cytochrome c family protein|nr:c-type cytochrome [Deltaproteobacteria bacterium]